ESPRALDRQAWEARAGVLAACSSAELRLTVRRGGRLRFGPPMLRLTGESQPEFQPNKCSQAEALTLIIAAMWQRRVSPGSAKTLATGPKWDFRISTLAQCEDAKTQSPQSARNYALAKESSLCSGGPPGPPPVLCGPESRAGLHTTYRLQPDALVTPRAPESGASFRWRFRLAAA